MARLDKAKALSRDDASRRGNANLCSRYSYMVEGDLVLNILSKRGSVV